jgi:hypothetical protein
MSEPTAPAAPAPKARAPRPAAEAAPSLPASGRDIAAYLQEKGWTPMGDVAWEGTLWYAPGFRLTESYAKVSEPMTGEVERHEAGKAALARGDISHNPEPRRREQVRVTPASRPMTTADAYRHQVESDLRERELRMRRERAAEDAHVG